MKKKQFFYGSFLFGLALFCQMVIVIFTIEGQFPLLCNQGNVKLGYILLWLCTIGIIFGRNLYFVVQKMQKMNEKLIWYALQLALFGLFTYMLLYCGNSFTALVILSVCLILSFRSLLQEGIIYVFPVLWQLYLFYMVYRIYLYL